MIANIRRGTRKIEAYVPVYGWWGTFREIFHNILLFEVVYRLEKDLSTGEEKVEPKIPLEVAMFDNGLDLPTWKDRHKLFQIRGEYGLEQFQERFDRGDKVFCGYSRGELAGFLWLEFPPISDVGYSLKMNEIYTHDGWTFTEFRGKRVLPVLQQAVFNFLRKDHLEIVKAVTHVAKKNRASYSGDTRAGYNPVRLELSVIIFGFHKKFPFFV